MASSYTHTLCISVDSSADPVLYCSSCSPSKVSLIVLVEAAVECRLDLAESFEVLKNWTPIQSAARVLGWLSCYCQTRNGHAQLNALHWLLCLLTLVAKLGNLSWPKKWKKNYVSTSHVKKIRNIQKCLLNQRGYTTSNKVNHAMNKAKL